MCTFKLWCPQRHRCTSTIYLLSSFHLSKVTHYNKFEPLNEWFPGPVCFPATLTGWQPLAQRAQWNHSLVFEGIWTWGRKSGKNHTNLWWSSSQSQVSLGSNSASTLWKFSVVTWEALPKSTTLNCFPLMISLNFYHFCIIFSSLLVRKKKKNSSLEINTA